MQSYKIVSDLKLHLAELLAEEQAAKNAGNDGFLAGLQFARVNLESLVEKHGVSRTITIENSSEKRIHSGRN